MLTEALKKSNESAPRDASGKKQGAVLKYVIVPTGLGSCQDEKLPDGSLNRVRIIEKFRTRCCQRARCVFVLFSYALAASTKCTVSPLLLQLYLFRHTRRQRKKLPR